MTARGLAPIRGCVDPSFVRLRLPTRDEMSTLTTLVSFNATNRQASQAGLIADAGGNETARWWSGRAGRAGRRLHPSEQQVRHAVPGDHAGAGAPDHRTDSGFRPACRRAGPHRTRIPLRGKDR